MIDRTRGESQAEPAVGARHGAVLLAKAIEDARKESRIDASASVVHGDRRDRGLRADARLDPTALRREFDGVCQQIPDGLLERIGVAEDENRTLLNEYIELDSPGLSSRTDNVGGGGNNVHQIDGRHLQVEFAGDDARHVELLVGLVMLTGGLAIRSQLVAPDVPLTLTSNADAPEFCALTPNRQVCAAHFDGTQETYI